MLIPRFGGGFFYTRIQNNYTIRRAGDLFFKLLTINDLRLSKTKKISYWLSVTYAPFSRFFANKANKSNNIHKLLVHSDLKIFADHFLKLLIINNLRLRTSPRAPKSLILNDLSCYFLGLTRSVVCAILIEVSAGKVKVSDSLTWICAWLLRKKLIR